MKTYRVIAIPGDGIGPELIDATLDVLEAIQAGGGFRLAIERVSAALMLDHLGEANAAERLRNAVWRALESGALTIGVDGCPPGRRRWRSSRRSEWPAGRR